MDLVTLTYWVIGGFTIFLALIYFGFQIIGYILLGDSPRPIDEEQRSTCHDSIHSGKSRNVFCRYFVKKGYCPHGDCKNFQK